MTVSNRVEHSKFKSITIYIVLVLIDKEEDEVLFAIAEELGKVWEMIQNKTVFIPILERLARSDETVVRE